MAESTLLEGPYTTAGADLEDIFAEVLAEVLHVDRVPVDGNFFAELGADSLVMAHFCARVRKRGGLPSLSMQDVYRHPTVRSLAAAVTAAAAGLNVPGQPVRAALQPPTRTSQVEYVVCGALQLLFFLGYSYAAALGAVEGYEWIAAGSNAMDTYVRSVLFGGAGFLVVCLFPILTKWVLVGRWKPGHIRLWSLAYVRFWIVKTLIRANPCALMFVGSPLYSLYLRALGAKIGPGVVIFSRRVPICTDLLTIGAGTVIRKESFFLCYRAHAGRLEIGPVTLGRDVFVGERAVFDINTSMGDGAQLGHCSSLHTGQAVPAGERWHGSPAQPTDLNYLRVAPARCDTLRRATFCVFTLLSAFFLYLPLMQAGLDLLVRVAPSLGTALDQSVATADVTVRGLVISALVISLLLFFGLVLVGSLLVVTIPRVFNRFVKPDTVYPLYGFHDRLQRVITRMTTIKFFLRLFGDSSYIVHYLRCLGYHLTPVEQTGSNFGTEVLHANPHLCTVGTGTMIADGLAMLNDEVSSTSFSVSRASIGPHNFVGNGVTYPAGGRTGDNCLLATKVMVPLSGKIHEGVGLLGSPCFEIPRSVDRDSRFDHLRTGDELRRGLAAKNRYNIRTMGVFLFIRWLGIFLVALLDLAALELYGVFANVPMAALFALSLFVSALYYAVMERVVAGFRPLQPTICSIYDPRFWLYERLWKVPAVEYFHAFDGTPFKNVIWRLAGVRIGRRVFDDGAHLPERTLTTIGDDCVLNIGVNIQCHSQEDGTFKSDRTSIGAGCTLGVFSLVHYGVTMGDGAVLAPDSFLMKGEYVPERARWGGNPAREI